MQRALHVAQISFFRDPEERLPSQLVHAWPSLVDVAEAARAGGAHVTVVQASSHRDHWERAGVAYRFLPFAEPAGESRANEGLGELLTQIAPDVFHVHGLGFGRDVLSLAALAPGVPIILQDHADKPPRFWRREPWRLQMSAVSALAFCAPAQARPFVEAGILPAHTPLYEIPESTSRFTPGDSLEMRRLTGLTGSPAVLWVGHLNENKDPLAVLEGISAAAHELPELQLWCYFGSAPLLSDVRRRIARDPALRGRVHLMGRTSHATIERVMRAADLFVLGSHQEGSGYSVIEALACGLSPIITDIPSFRCLTGGGAVGALWPCGDSRALAEALVGARFDAATRAAVRTHFDRELSMNALGRKLAEMYADVQARSHAPRLRTSANGGP